MMVKYWRLMRSPCFLSNIAAFCPGTQIAFLTPVLIRAQRGTLFGQFKELARHHPAQDKPKFLISLSGVCSNHKVIFKSYSPYQAAVTGSKKVKLKITTYTERTINEPINYFLIISEYGPFWLLQIFCIYLRTSTILAFYSSTTAVFFLSQPIKDLSLELAVSSCYPSCILPSTRLRYTIILICPSCISSKITGF